MEKVSDMDKSELESLIVNAVQAATKPISAALKKLTEEVTRLKSDIEAKDAKIKDLEYHFDCRLDELEQYGRRNNLRIFGVKETDREVTDDIVVDVASKMDVKLNASCIDRSHRVGRIGSGGQPRPIIVKFTSYAYRSLMFRSKKKLKGTNITVREDLTKPRLKLIKDAVSAYSEKNVWSSDGVVMVNVGLRRPFRLRCPDDLKELLHKHPPDQE